MWWALGTCECWWHSNHSPNNDIQFASNLALIRALWIVHCTLNSIWRESLHYAKSTSNHGNVKLRRLRFNPTSNQPKHHSLRFVGANCSFTYLLKTIIEIHPQETKKNSLVGLVLSLHHLSNHRLGYRTFPVTKEITRTRLNLNTWVSVGISPTVMGYVPDTWLEFIILKSPCNMCHFNF